MVITVSIDEKERADYSRLQEAIDAVPEEAMQRSRSASSLAFTRRR